MTQLFITSNSSDYDFSSPSLCFSFSHLFFHLIFPLSLSLILFSYFTLVFFLSLHPSARSHGRHRGFPIIEANASVFVSIFKATGLWCSFSKIAFDEKCKFRKRHIFHKAFTRKKMKIAECWLLFCCSLLLYAVFVTIKLHLLIVSLISTHQV